MGARQQRHYKPKGRTPDRRRDEPLDPKRKPTARDIAGDRKPEARVHHAVSTWRIEPHGEVYGFDELGRG
jgi:hypothetical protein